MPRPPDVLAAVAVDCYASAQGDETPRRFTRGDQLVEVLAVVAQWRTPDHRHFRVKTADETCTLRQEVMSGGWELKELGRNEDPRRGDGKARRRRHSAPRWGSLTQIEVEFYVASPPPPAYGAIHQSAAGIRPRPRQERAAGTQP